MIISKAFYAKCCPSYQKVIDEHERIIEHLKGKNNPFWDKHLASEIISLILYKLAGSCLVSKEYWDYCYSLMQSRGESDKERRQHLKKFSNAHFYFKKNFTFNIDEFHGLLLEYQYHLGESGFQCSEYHISYPHSHLKQCFRQIERNSTCQPSDKLVKKYEAMKKMYLEIKAEEQDSEKWFKVLTEVDNLKFVCDNVENRLCENLLDAELWKRYIEFLREKDSKRMLLIYFKYCRFFMDDLEMKEKYKEEMVKYGPLPSEKKYDYTWNRWFDFEKIDKEDVVKEEESKNLNVKKEKGESFDKSLCKIFFDKIKSQNFSFRDSLITYILDSATSHRVLEKLFQTCKYFFARKQILICYRLEAWVEDCLCLENLFFKTREEISKLPKIFLTGCIDVLIEIEDIYVNSEDTDDDESEDTDNDNSDEENETVAVKKEEDAIVKSGGRSFISSFIPHIYRSTAKFICLYNQNISFNELQFLISHGNVIELKLKTCELKDNDGKNYIDLEKILKFLPNIEKLHLSDVNVTSNTSNALTNQKNFGKISKFAIKQLNGEPFDVDEFLKFLIATRDKKLKLTLFFNDKFDRDFVKNFKNVYKNDELSYRNTKITIY